MKDGCDVLEDKFTILLPQGHAIGEVSYLPIMTKVYCLQHISSSSCVCTIGEVGKVLILSVS